jgi:hypothetical protein
MIYGTKNLKIEKDTLRVFWQQLPKPDDESTSCTKVKKRNG